MRDSSLFRNLVANFGGYIVSAVVTLFLTPVIVSNLGNDRYGAWSLVGQFIGYYGYLDIGIRGALSHYLARHSASGSLERAREAFATALWTLTAIGVLVIVVSIAFALVLPRAFDFGNANPRDAQLALSVLSTAIAVNLPASVFTSVLIANRRLDLLNGVEIATRIASACVVYFTMYRGGGLLSLAIIQAAAMLANCATTALLARRIAPRLNLRPRWYRKDSLKELATYGGKSSVINLTLVAIDQLDLLIVAFSLGVTWVTYYSIGASLVAYAWTASAALALAFTPHMVQLHAAGKHEELVRIFLQGERLVGLFSSTVFACLLLLGGSFIELWLGERYVTGRWGWRSDAIMLVLALANLPRVYQGIARQLLFASRLHGQLVWIMLGEAVANIILSLVLVRRFGPVGTAFGTLLPCVVSHGIILPWYVLRKFGIGVRRYLFEAIGPPLFVGATLYATGTVTVGTVAIDTWPRFILAAAACAATGAILSFALGTTREERRRWRNGTKSGEVTL